MRDQFEQHAQWLTHEERHMLWVTVSTPRKTEAAVRVRWAWSAAAAVVAVAWLGAATLRFEPVGSRHASPGASPGTLTDGTASSGGPTATPRGGAPSRSVAEDVARRVAPRPVPEIDPSLLQLDPPVLGLERRRDAPVSKTSTAVAGTGTVTGRVRGPKGEAMAYANVIVNSLRVGTMSDENGNYRLVGLVPGAYTVRAQMVGYEAQLQAVRVESDQTAKVDFRFEGPMVVKTLEMITVSAEKRIATQASTVRHVTSADRLRELPVDNLASPRVPEHVRVRGGRSGETRYQFDGVESSSPLTASPDAPAAVPTTGGTHVPNDAAFDAMFFKHHGVNPFIATDEDPLSTFAVDVDAASYTVTRRYLELGHLPPADAVRVEEFVNYFPQNYPRFTKGEFRILMDGAPSPFGNGHHLLRIGLKGRDVPDADRKPAQLTFVIDVSGSMQREDRLELVKRALHLLVGELGEGDEVGIVVYGTTGRVLLEPVALEASGARVASLRGDGAEAWDQGRRGILRAIDQLRPEGATNAEEGLRLGYDMARRGYRSDATNRIVLCSDGVANVGVTGPESILARVRSEADRGIHLTTIGFGMGNYNDVLMEQLADRGDGNHYYVDGIDEARRVLVEDLTGTLQTIAQDAKVQVEFDSTRVLRYRLLGFENRDVADRDFRNDRVDAGEIGAGHEVTALYEVKLAPDVRRGTLATVRLRYRRPSKGEKVAPDAREIEARFDAESLSGRFEDAAPEFRLDAAVAEFAELLRGSHWAKESKLSDVLPVAKRAARDLRDDTTTGFVLLLEKAVALTKRSKPDTPDEEP